MKRKATYQPEHRTHTVSFKMNEDEWQMFQSQLEKLELSQSDFIRQSIFSAQVKVTVHPVYDSEVLDEIAAQYGKIGSNINQIAHHLNADNPMTARMMKDLNHCLADMSDLKQKLYRLSGDA